MAAAIILAAGMGERLGADRPKAFAELGGRTLLERAASAAAAAAEVDTLVVAVPEGQQAMVRERLSFLELPVEVVAGGPSRHASVDRALAALDDTAETIAVHDAARCLASPTLFDRVLAAVGSGAAGAIPVVPVSDTVKRTSGDVVVETVPREDLRVAQTPQAFRTADLREAHELASDAGLDFTDDAACLEWNGCTVVTVEGELTNLKITTPEDLVRAEAVIRSGADV